MKGCREWCGVSGQGKGRASKEDAIRETARGRAVLHRASVVRALCPLSLPHILAAAEFGKGGDRVWVVQEAECVLNNGVIRAEKQIRLALFGDG